MNLSISAGRVRLAAGHQRQEVPDSDRAMAACCVVASPTEAQESHCGEDLAPADASAEV